MQVNCEWPSQARWRLRFLGHLVRQHGKLASIAWLPATCGDKERSHELRRQSQDLIFEVLFGPSNFGATWTCKSTCVQQTPVSERTNTGIRAFWRLGCQTVGSCTLP